MAIALEVELPDDLALWRLAGGRPAPGVATAGSDPVDPGELGDLLEAASDRSRRRRHGIHHTPAAVADGLVERALQGRADGTVGDPACGGGALLLAAGRALVRAGLAPAAAGERLFGADLDPVAVATTEVSLLLWSGVRPAAGRLVVADALLERPWPSVDVVVGNPPFLSPLGTATARPTAATEQLRDRYGPAVQAYTDAAALFLLAGLDLVAPTGTVAMLQPLSVLGSRDAGPLRAAVDRRAGLREVWVPAPGAFRDAAVSVCAVVLDRHEEAEDPGPPVRAAAEPGWSIHLARATGVPEVRLDGAATVGTIAEVLAAFRQEYYGTAPHVGEAAASGAGARPLVTTGLVDLGSCAWGRRPARLAGRSWVAPVVAEADLEGRAAQWAARTRRPKVLVASQARVLEVAVDADGSWLPGVPLVAAVPHDPGDLWALAAALAAPPVVAWAATRVAGTGRSPGSLRVGAPLLRSVPLPVDADAWREGAAALERGDLLAFGAAMTAAHRAAPEVLAWWCERAKVGCPPPPGVR